MDEFYIIIEQSYEDVVSVEIFDKYDLVIDYIYKKEIKNNKTYCEFNRIPKETFEEYKNEITKEDIRKQLDKYESYRGFYIYKRKINKKIE